MTTSFSSDTDVARRRFFYVRNRNWSAIDVLKRNHPYITSAKDWVDGFLEMAVFADVQYCIYADVTPLVGGSEKVPKGANVIY